MSLIHRSDVFQLLGDVYDISHSYENNRSSEEVIALFNVSFLKIVSSCQQTLASSSQDNQQLSVTNTRVEALVQTVFFLQGTVENLQKMVLNKNEEINNLTNIINQFKFNRSGESKNNETTSRKKRARSTEPDDEEEEEVFDDEIGMSIDLDTEGAYTGSQRDSLVPRLVWSTVSGERDRTSLQLGRESILKNGVQKPEATPKSVKYWTVQMSSGKNKNKNDLKKTDLNNKSNPKNLNNLNNNHNMNKITNKKKINALIIGKKSNIGIQAAPRFLWFYFGNWDKSVKKCQVLEHIKEILQTEDIEVEELDTSKQKRFNSFKFRCNAKLLEIIKNPDNWPEGIIINIFFSGRPKEQVDNVTVTADLGKAGLSVTNSTSTLNQTANSGGDNTRRL